MQKNLNPFVTSAEVYSDDIFFGRERIIEKINEFVLHENHSLFILTGQRRIGKTSLLKRSEANLKKISDNVVYFTLQGENQTPLHELISNVLGCILDYQEAEDAFSAEMDLNQLTDIFISQIKAEQVQPENTVLLFDEFDVLLNPELDCFNNAVIKNNTFVDFIKLLSEKSVTQKLPLKIIAAIGRNYKELDEIRFGDLLKNAEKCEIDYFNKDTLDNLLDISSKNVRFENDAKDEIWTLSGGQPFFAQIIAFISFETANKQEQNFVNQRLAKGVVKIVLKRFETGFNSLWDSFSQTDKSILVASAIIYEQNNIFSKEQIFDYLKLKNSEISIDELNSSLNRLLNNKYLESTEENYLTFRAELLQKWILKKNT